MGKGFYKEVRIHDYPMRGRSYILLVKKLWWYNHADGKYVFCNWKLIAIGGKSLLILRFFKI